MGLLVVAVQEDHLRTGGLDDFRTNSSVDGFTADAWINETRQDRKR